MKTLYRRGSVLTMDPGVGTVDAFLVENGCFAAVGREAHELGATAQVVDLGGRTVVPGLIDAHAHLETDAVSHAVWVDVRAVSQAVVLERLRQRVSSVGPGEWVIGQATFGQDQEMLGRAELDKIAPLNPVLIRASMHALSANTRALTAAGLLDRRATPTGVLIRRDAGGEPTGQLMEAYHLFPVPVPAVGELAVMIEEEIRERFNRYGVTTIYEVPMSREGVRAFQALDRAGRLNARVSLNLAVKPGLQPLVDDIGQWASSGLASGFGNERLWLGAAKYFLDGAYDASYLVRRDPKRPGRWGTLTHLYSDVVRALVTGYDAGIQVWFHALGEDAQLLAIDAAIEAQRIYGGDAGLRTRIEHIFNDYPVSVDILEHLRAARIIPVPNAVFIHFNDGSGAFPYRTLLREGFMPPGNSDNSGTQPFANNPWFGIAKMVMRSNKHGRMVNPDEQIGVSEGIRTYTEFGAYAGHREGVLGVIRRGAPADFAVLDADPLSVEHEDLAAIESELTVLGGRIVWEK